MSLDPDVRIAAVGILAEHSAISASEDGWFECSCGKTIALPDSDCLPDLLAQHQTDMLETLFKLVSMHGLADGMARL